MCGIVGLYLKNKALEPELGALTAKMLHEMRERGPDSAGFAVYGEPSDRTLITALANEPVDWIHASTRISQVLAADVDHTIIEDHCVFETTADGAAARKLLIEEFPALTVLSTGQSIQLFKGVGDPDIVAERFGLANRSGSHAIAHTRMATESAVTTAGSHPFSTGADTCLVHNGSLSNHNRLREVLKAGGETFQTANDSEVAAAYLAMRVRNGDTLEMALKGALQDLDGFFTFAVGTKDGFAVLRDPVACKPAVIAETDDWVAMSSEFRAIATLPNVSNAEIWEPEPSVIYSWDRSKPQAVAA